MGQPKNNDAEVLKFPCYECNKPAGSECDMSNMEWPWKDSERFHGVRKFTSVLHDLIALHELLNIPTENLVALIGKPTVYLTVDYSKVELRLLALHEKTKGTKQ